MSHKDISSCDESTLAAQCARGDKASQEELYRRYSGRILSLCRRYSRDCPEAEDYMQEAFIKVFRKIGRFVWTGPGSLYSWMSRVTINTCFDSIKKRKRLVEQLSGTLDGLEVIDEDNSSPPVPDIPPEKLREIVESLPEAYGAVFKLHCVDGLSHKEIGGLLGIKEKSSSSNCARAKAILIRKINEYSNQSEVIYEQSGR